MIHTFASDWLKMRHAWITFLVVFGPTGVIGVSALLYLIKYNDLVKPGLDNWGNLVQNIHPLLVAALSLGIALLASLIAGLEHQADSWKMLCALPISKFKLYLSKFLIIVCLLTASVVISAMGTTFLGLILGFGFKIPLITILSENFGILVSALAIVAMQLYLSTIISNQVISLIIGVVGVIFNLAYRILPHWLPWVYPNWADPLSSPNPQIYWEAGFALGIILLIIGGIDFTRREIKQ